MAPIPLIRVLTETRSGSFESARSPRALGELMQVDPFQLHIPNRLPAAFFCFMFVPNESQHRTAVVKSM